MQLSEYIAECETDATRVLDLAKKRLEAAAEEHTKAEDRLEDAQDFYQRALDAVRREAEAFEEGETEPAPRNPCLMGDAVTVKR